MPASKDNLQTSYLEADLRQHVISPKYVSNYYQDPGLCFTFKHNHKQTNKESKNKGGGLGKGLIILLIFISLDGYCNADLKLWKTESVKSHLFPVYIPSRQARFFQALRITLVLFLP